MTLMNATPPNPANKLSHQYSTVSIIKPLFMMTVMPRANATTSATPTMSAAPAIKLPTKSPSFMRATRPMMMPNTRKSADNSANHQ
ncbi:MAG: hypothetical protein HDKAJFGB_03866 [Anaerolineae bacterium]|nr:hypothetical protein [Anaerolineae bacterium]